MTIGPDGVGLTADVGVKMGAEVGVGEGVVVATAAAVAVGTAVGAGVGLAVGAAPPPHAPMTRSSAPMNAAPRNMAGILLGVQLSVNERRLRSSLL
jgi:hypothetical protein